MITQFNCHPHVHPQLEPNIEAFADISRSALCCDSDETRALIVNPPNSVQLRGTSYHSPKLHPRPCSSAGMRQRTDRQTDTQRRVTTIHLASSIWLTWNVMSHACSVYIICHEDEAIVISGNVCESFRPLTRFNFFTPAAISGNLSVLIDRR